MRNLVAIVLAALVLPACDPGQCPQVSGPFGPCVPGYSACAEGSTCFVAETGDMCLPTSLDGTFPAGYEACALQLGKRLTCTVGQTCRIECDIDAECGGGTVCSKAGLCVWPPAATADTTSTTAGDVSSSASEAMTAPMTTTIETSTGQW